MILFKKTGDFKKYLGLLSEKKLSVGFVPTMGALHEGHVSLMKLSKEQNDITVVSIFVNPLQFNDRKDFDKYPVSLESDIVILEALNIDILFHPEEKEIYPHGDSVAKKFNLGSLESVLEGASRPGHFQGVARVMDILLHIVQPQQLYLGQKDFQQIKVIQRLIDLENLVIRVIAAPLIREASGLAMSSRNERLDPASRKKAALIYKNLVEIKNNAHRRSFQELRDIAIRNLEIEGFKIDYLVLANRETLEELKAFDKKIPAILLIAVHLGEIRLIDNLFI